MSSSITVISVINVEHETSFRKSLEFLLRRKLFRFFFFSFKFILTEEIVIYLFIFWSSQEILQISCVFGNLLNLSILS